MSRLVRVLGVAALALFLGSSPTTLRPTPAPDFGRRVAEALADGRIDRAHAALYWLYALKAPDRLPAEFRADLPAGAAARFSPDEADGWALRCGTTALRGVRADLANLPAGARAEAEALLQTRAPARALRVAGKTVSHALPRWILTEHFSVEWGADLTNADGTVPAADVDGDGVPDVVEQWAAYFEASYAAEVGARGYAVAALDEMYVPVYLGNSQPDTSVDNISGTTYAITNDSPVSVVVNNNLSFVPSNQDPQGRIPGAMKVTAAHEFHHVLQFLMPLPAAWNPSRDDWWLEASATWMEEEVFDQVDDYHQYYRGTGGWASLAATGLAVNTASGDYTTKAYGNAVFGKYLSEHVGGAEALKSVWNLIAPVPGGGKRILFDDAQGTSVSGGALNAFAVQKGFGGLGELMVGFAAANATMDYREGSAYGAVPVEAQSLASTVASPNGPLFLGAHYLRSTGGNGAGVEVGLTGDPASPWGLGFVLRRAGYDAVLGDVGPSGAASLSLATWDAGRELLAIPVYLRPHLPAAGLPPPQPNGYSTVRQAASPAPNAPGEVRSLAVASAAGGLDVTWDPPVGGGVPAGYVVRWKRSTDASFASRRTLFGPITRIELRGLPVAAHDVAVFAYGAAGEPGPESTPASATPAAAVPTPIPSAEPYAEVHLATSDGGGGGGGGCFVQALGRP